MPLPYPTPSRQISPSQLRILFDGLIAKLAEYLGHGIVRIPVVRQNTDLHLNQADRQSILLSTFVQTCLMLRLLMLLSALPICFFRSRRDLLLENLALRQQLAVLKRRRPQRRFDAMDRLFWVGLTASGDVNH